MRLSCLAALAAAFLAAAPVAASAHAILVASNPAIGATIPSGELALNLRYNSRIDAARSRLTLIRPDLSQTVLPISTGSQDDVLTARIDTTPGMYVVRWQVLAVDGHITRGDVPFTVAAAK